MSKLIAIDPGLRCSGVAFFVNGKLERAFLARGSKAAGTQAWLDMAKAIKQECIEYAEIDKFDELVLEFPQVYRSKYQKGDPNDLLQLAAVVGVIAATGFYTKINYFLPREWKGQVTKEITEARVKKKLSKEELGRIELTKNKKLNTNIWDAIGIGIYYLNGSRALPTKEN